MLKASERSERLPPSILAAVLLPQGLLVVPERPQAGGLPIWRPALGDGLLHERGKRTSVEQIVKDFIKISGHGLLLAVVASAMTAMASR